jgi:RNase H-fold protein (predicted Holliday junction resolvase)
MIAAIDPGSEKTGFALVSEDGACVSKKIIPTEKLETQLADIFRNETPRVLVLGNGTHHKEMKRRLENFLAEKHFEIPIALVNEKYTTEMGEARWKQDHPAQGLAKLLPEGLREVKEPVDDYVAWIIAQIYLGLIREEDIGHKK